MTPITSLESNQSKSPLLFKTSAPCRSSLPRLWGKQIPTQESLRRAPNPTPPHPRLRYLHHQLSTILFSKFSPVAAPGYVEYSIQLLGGQAESAAFWDTAGPLVSHSEPLSQSFPGPELRSALTPGHQNCGTLPQRVDGHGLSQD